MDAKDKQISDAKKKQPAKSRMWKILPDLVAFPTNKWYRGKKGERKLPERKRQYYKH